MKIGGCLDMKRTTNLKNNPPPRHNFIWTLELIVKLVLDSLAGLVNHSPSSAELRFPAGVMLG